MWGVCGHREGHSKVWPAVRLQGRGLIATFLLRFLCGLPLRASPPAVGLHTRFLLPSPRCCRAPAAGLQHQRTCVEDYEQNMGGRARRKPNPTVRRSTPGSARKFSHGGGSLPYWEVPLTMRSARSQPIPVTKSTNSTHVSRFCIQALRSMSLMLPSSDAAAPVRSTSTSQRGHPSRTAEARGMQLPSSGAAPRESAGERGRSGSPGPQRGRLATAGRVRRRAARRARPR